MKKPTRQYLSISQHVTNYHLRNATFTNQLDWDIINEPLVLPQNVYQKKEALFVSKSNAAKIMVLTCLVKSYDEKTEKKT